jgi:hypothetical protein
MSNPAAQCAQAQTVANALSGEKSFEIVQFAITGNPTADAISGIQAVLNAIKLGSMRVPHSRHTAMLMDYLARVYAMEATEEEAQVKRNRECEAVNMPPPKTPWPGSRPLQNSHNASGTIDALKEEREAAQMARWESARAMIERGDDRPDRASGLK